MKIDFAAVGLAAIKQELQNKMLRWERPDLVGQEAIAVLIPPMKEYMISDGPHRQGAEHFRCSDECPFMRAPHEPCSIGLGELKPLIFMGCDYGKRLFPGPDCPASQRESKP